MSLTPLAVGLAAKLNEVSLAIMVQLQLTEVPAPEVQAAPCYAAKTDFVDAFKPLFNWAFGNVRGITPWVAAGLAMVLGLMIVVKTMSRDDASPWLRAVGWLLIGLAVVLFVPTVIFALADSAPSGC